VKLISKPIETGFDWFGSIYKANIYMKKKKKEQI